MRADRTPETDSVGGSIEAIHQRACDAGLDHYTDPSTGYRVFTALAHQRRGYCCGSACRHCPYDHINVRN